MYPQVYETEKIKIKNEIFSNINKGEIIVIRSWSRISKEG